MIPAAGKELLLRLPMLMCDANADVQTIHVQTNFVEVPFTVKDKKGRLVPGLTWRDVRVYENGLRRADGFVYG